MSKFIFGTEHPFSRRGFGSNLIKVTDVDPLNPPSDARRLSSFTKKELEKRMNSCKVLKELNMNKEKETLPNIIDAILRHFGETGVLKGIILPFIESKSELVEPDDLLFDMNTVYLNYGPDGKGGQRNPKPRHILEMMRKFDINQLTIGMARQNPDTGEVFVNEGQQRSITAGILGKTKMCYQIRRSDDPTVDYIQYKGENSGKLSQSDVETYESDAIICANQAGDNHLDLSLTNVANALGMTQEQDEFLHYKMKRMLVWDRHHPITMVNKDADKKERFETGHCSNYNQMSDIFETKEYIENNNRVLKSALDAYQQIWSKRAMITGDLILFLEFFYWNQWLYELDKQDQDYFMLRLKNCVLTKWPDNKTGSAGASNRAVWNVVQDLRKDHYPRITREQEQQNQLWYSHASPRVAECMWIGTAMYSLVKNNIGGYMDQEDLDRLVQPYETLEDGSKLTYDLIDVK